MWNTGKCEKEILDPVITGAVEPENCWQWGFLWMTACLATLSKVVHEIKMA
jgi:hypothetical protein